jgi:hypothetical protein
MSTSLKPSTSDKLLGLMIVTGFMLLLSALPLGLVLSLQDHYKFHSDWHWAIILGVVMTAATAVVGGIFLCTGEFIVQRRRKTRL